MKSESLCLNLLISDQLTMCLSPNSMWNNVVNSWWSIVLYPATDALKFRKGMIAMICVCVMTLAITWVVYSLERREWRQRKTDHLDHALDKRDDSLPRDN